MEEIEPENFDSVFGSEPKLTYNEQTISTINNNRHTLENELFFDRLMKAIGLDQEYTFPPRSNQDLRKLHEGIVTASSPNHHKQSLVYYILKDVPYAYKNAQEYAAKCYLPKKYQVFIDGIWHLDRLMFEIALDYLTEPCLIPTFPEEILYTLCRHGSRNDITLPLAYYHSVSPAISSTKILDTFFNILCQVGITEAFFFSRTKGEFIHHHLFERLISFVHGNCGGDKRATRAIELVSLPLNDMEDSWFDLYLMDGKGKHLYGSKDTIMMRRIATGKTREAVELKANMTGKKIEGIDWPGVREGLQQGCEPLLLPEFSMNR